MGPWLKASLFWFSVCVAAHAVSISAEHELEVAELHGMEALQAQRLSLTAALPVTPGGPKPRAPPEPSKKLKSGTAGAGQARLASDVPDKRAAADKKKDAAEKLAIRSAAEKADTQESTEKAGTEAAKAAAEKTDKKPAAVVEDLSLGAKNSSNLVQMVNTDALDGMVKAGGDAVSKHYGTLKKLASDLDGNASVAELGKMEKTAHRMVESYLTHAEAESNPKVSEATEVVRDTSDEAKREARKAALLRRQVRADKAALKQAKFNHKLMRQYRDAAEVVVKDKAKHIDAADAAVKKAKAAEAKARASILKKGKNGQKLADDAYHALEMAEVKQKLIQLKLKRAVATLHVHRNGFLVASSKLESAKLAVARHESEEKSAEFKQEAAARAVNEAKHLENEAIVAQKRDAKLSSLQDQAAQAEARMKELNVQTQRAQKKLAAAVKAAKKTGSESDKINVDEINKQLEDLNVEQARAEKKANMDTLAMQKSMDQDAKEAVERVANEIKEHKLSAQAISTELAQAKQEAQEAGRQAQSDAAEAKQSRKPEMLDAAKDSLQTFQNMEGKVKALQHKLARATKEASSLETQQRKALNAASSTKKGLSQQVSKVKALDSFDALDAQVAQTLTKSDQVSAQAAPEQVALRSEAVSRTRKEENGKEDADAAELKKAQTNLYNARTKQAGAAKGLHSAIRHYMINATSRASGKELASLTLGVSQSITNLQKAQVEVERFKAEEVALAKRQDKDVKKFEAGVVKNLKALEEEVKPDLTKEQKNAQVLQDLGPRSGYTEATDNLKAKAEALTAAESVLKEMQLRAKTSTGDNSEKAKFNVKVAEKAVTQAKEDKEDAEMTQEAEKEAMVAVASAIKNATKAKQAQKAEEKQKASEQKNLEAVSSQLAAAALLGDGAGMVDILKESMANETAAKIQEWPGSIRDGKRIGPIQAMSETSSPKLKKIYNETATKLVHDLEDNTLANEDSASNSTIY